MSQTLVKYAYVEPRELAKPDYEHIANLLKDPLLIMWLYKQEQLGQSELTKVIITNEKEAIKLSGKIETFNALLNFPQVIESIINADKKAEDELVKTFEKYI